ncbi:cytochrome P450, partial [Wolfiporia cocos MD-104 SS10]
EAYYTWSSLIHIGAVVSLPVFGQDVIIVNSIEAATELLDARRNFACRPRWPMADLLGRQRSVGFHRYGERLKKLRKILHASLSSSVVTSTWSARLEAQSISLCKALLCNQQTVNVVVEDNMQDHIINYIYGRRPTPEYTQLLKQVMHETGVALQPGRWLVNFIPALAWIPAWTPGAAFQRWAREARESLVALTHQPFHRVQVDMLDGVSTSSFVKRSLESLSNPSSVEDREIVMDAAGSFMTAGIDTLVSIIQTFLAIMVRHEAVQNRAYQEIIEVVGTHRLPGLEHRGSLPYVDAVIQEVFRFNPPIPLLSRSNIEEDGYDGYRIPQRSWILGNLWGILHDETRYPDADQFVPERFIPSDGTSKPLDPRSIVFGFGRRRCPGVHFAEMLVYLIVARLLRLCVFSPEVQDGTIVLPPIDFMTSLVP